MRRTMALLVGMMAMACGTNAGPTGPTLCVVRHAQAWKNVSPRPAGMPLDELTPTGRAQAQALSDRLPAKVAAVWASPAHRTQQTAGLLDRGAVRRTPLLRSLDGEMAWGDRVAAWKQGEDPRPPGGGERLTDGQRRVQSLLGEARAAAGADGTVVWVTHGDIAAVAVGELEGTPLLERVARHELGTGAVTCAPLR